MTDYEEGYLQAVKDVKARADQMVDDLGAASSGKIEIGHFMSFLDRLVAMKERRHGGQDGKEAPDPISGSF